MHNNFSKIPSPASLIGFEASARHLSFTRAAEELNLSQAAISKQITNLEDRIGRKLFIRKHRALALTKEGQILFEGVSNGLRHIQSALNWIGDSADTHSVTLSATTAFAQMWLLPRLAKFKQDNPHIDLRLLTSDDNFNPLDSHVDIAIKYGDDSWTQIHSTYLLSAEVTPVCSPKLIEKYPLNSPEDLEQAPLLDLDEHHWQWVHWYSWLQNSGISIRHNQAQMEFNNIPMLYHAAEEGQGVALGWSILVQDLLESGRLIAPFQEHISLNKPWGYYLIQSLESNLSPEAMRVREWLIRETENFGHNLSGVQSR